MSISRRDFSKASLGAGALFALGSSTTIAKSSPLTKAIPSTGEQVPVIGIGTNRYGVGDDADLRAPLKSTLQKFHELGGTVIDTAPGYRTSESVLGDLTNQLGISDDMFLATKVDVEGRDASKDRMNRSFELLKTDKMDLMQVHNFHGWEESLPIMQEWKEEGRIRYIGVTTSREKQYDLMEKVMKQFDLDFVQVNYSLANQRVSDQRILPLAADRGMAVMVNRPFGGGGVFKALAQASIPEWAMEFGAQSWGQFLLKYVISHPATTCAIPGMTKSRHVEDNFGAAKGRLATPAERAKMETFFDDL